MRSSSTSASFSSKKRDCTKRSPKGWIVLSSFLISVMAWFSIMGVVRTSNFARKEAKSVDKKAIRVVPRRYSTGLKSVSTYSFLGPKLKQYKALKAFPPFVDTAVQCVWYIICNAISLPHIEISVNACYHFCGSWNSAQMIFHKIEWPPERFSFGEAGHDRQWRERAKEQKLSFRQAGNRFRENGSKFWSLSA